MRSLKENNNGLFGLISLIVLLFLIIVLFMFIESIGFFTFAGIIIIALAVVVAIKFKGTVNFSWYNPALWMAVSGIILIIVGRYMGIQIVP